MDLQHITSNLKKQSKKAAKIVLAPVTFVTKPLEHMNTALRKKVFGPSLTIFAQIIAAEQKKLLQTKYTMIINEMKTELKKASLPTGKLTAYTRACTMIGRAVNESMSFEEGVDLIDQLLDELKTACTHGVPTKLRAMSFEIDKKTTYSAAELTVITAAISALKKQIHELLAQVTHDLSGAYLTHFPKDNLLGEGMTHTHELLIEYEKTFQSSLLKYQEQLTAARSIVREIAHQGEQLKHIGSQQKTLFSPEKARMKQAEDGVKNQLDRLVNKNLAQWSKNLTKKYTTLLQNQAKFTELRKDTDELWTVFEKKRNVRHGTVNKYASSQMKQIQNGKRQRVERMQEAAKQLNTKYLELNKIFASSKNLFDYQNYLDIATSATNTYHIQLMQEAQYLRHVYVLAELPEISNNALIKAKEETVIQQIGLKTDYLIFLSFQKRLIGWLMQTLGTYQSMLREYDAYAPKSFQTASNNFTSASSKLQALLKSLEQEQAAHKKQLSADKKELRDMVNFKRLHHLLRGYIADQKTSAVAEFCTTSYTLFVDAEKNALRALKTALKRGEQHYQMNLAAFTDQEKTVHILKNKDQQKKLGALKKAVDTLQHALTQLHTSSDETTDTIVDYQDLIKKYATYASTHQNHALKEHQLASDLAVKLRGSSLSRVVNCSATPEISAA